MVDRGLEDEIRALEERLLLPDVRTSPDELERLLADDFVEFGASGRAFDRAAIIRALATESGFHASISEFRVARLAAGVVLATYRLVADGSPAGRRHSLRSSIWVRRDDRPDGVWRLAFHQGTRTDDPAATP